MSNLSKLVRIEEDDFLCFLETKEHTKDTLKTKTSYFATSGLFKGDSFGCVMHRRTGDAYYLSPYYAIKEGLI